MVEQEEVDAVDTKAAQAAGYAIERRLVAVVADPELGRHERLAAVNAGAADALADLPLVPIRSCRV